MQCWNTWQQHKSSRQANRQFGSNGCFGLCKCDDEAGSRSTKYPCSEKRLNPQLRHVTSHAEDPTWTQGPTSWRRAARRPTKMN